MKSVFMNSREIAPPSITTASPCPELWKLGHLVLDGQARFLQSTEDGGVSLWAHWGCARSLSGAVVRILTFSL